jgi:hypothetical protein
MGALKSYVDAPAIHAHAHAIARQLHGEGRAEHRHGDVARQDLKTAFFTVRHVETRSAGLEPHRNRGL